MEFQMARPVRGTTLYEQFMKLNSPEFMGATNPLVAEEWLKKLDTIFEVIEVTDEQKLTLATFMLRGEARNWWETMRRMQNAQPEGVPISWRRFVEIFNDQYFPRIYRMQKEQEFMSLKKKTMFVVEYEEKFTALSRFAPEMVHTEDMKCRQFEWGLDWQIWSRVSMFEINIYSELVNKAKIAERDVMEFQNRREHFKKRRFDSGAGPSRQRSSDVTTTAEQSRAEPRLMRGVQDLIILEVGEILGEEDRGDHQLDLILHDLVLREVLFVIGVVLKVIWFVIVHCHGWTNVISARNLDT
ncbi:uncharacterized protein LOC130765643 [Actinidia eriantha]|uniref:uncharacterized protein LOC130765643 n=1 Tax=Actinidia eriantha TaxID=165200 RepID=UPI00259125FC|nr:uncharacterized protein LOC130765643 [Actinidia eriantha]XP_057478101.1 uncharacterized protein LOC130765643 [Actinidia eriantha]